MLGDLLGVRQQIGFQRLIFLGSGTALAGPRDGTDRHPTLFGPGQNFRRRTGNMEVVQIQIEHVGRRIQVTQGAVQIHGRRLERTAHALGRYHLHHITGKNVLANLLHPGLELLLRKLALEIALVHRIAIHGMFWLRQRRAQLLFQGFQASLRLFRSPFGCGVHMHNQIESTTQVVEHHHFF